MVSCHIADPTVARPGCASVGVLVENEPSNLCMLQHGCQPYTVPLSQASAVNNCASDELFHKLARLRSHVLTIRWRYDRISRFLHFRWPHSQNIHNTFRQVRILLSNIISEVSVARECLNQDQLRFQRIREVLPSLPQYEGQLLQLEQSNPRRICQLLNHPQQQLERISSTLLSLLSQIRSPAVVPAPHHQAQPIAVAVQAMAESGFLGSFQAQVEDEHAELIKNNSK